MGKLSSLLALGLVLVSVQISYGQIRSCLDIKDCMKYFESPDCDADGKRLVCLSWIAFPGCTALTAPLGRVQICKMNSFVKPMLEVTEQQCDNVPGDTMYDFGIMGAPHLGNTGSGSITVNGYTNSGGLVACSGFENVCSDGGNTDFKLTFHVRACPPRATTTTAAPATTTTVAAVTQPGCTCDQWSNWSGCSATCGSHAMRSQTRSCSHCGSSSPPLTQTETCPGVAANCPVDGMWADWGQWSLCPVTCGGNTQTRTRTCTMPAPAYGGAGCAAPSSETKVCNVNHCPTSGGSGGGGGGGGRGGGRRGPRGCRRRAKQGRCRRLRGSARRRCINLQCN